jgi:mono/diheme cytochrome c family protein
MRTSFLRATLATIALGVASLAAPAWVAAQKPPGAWTAPPGAKDLRNPVKNDGNTIARGKEQFNRFCLPCHGAKGAGDGAMAKKLGYKPANLTLARMNEYADGELFWKISKGGSPMPDFDKQLSARERWDTVSYIRTLVREIDSR